MSDIKGYTLHGVDIYPQAGGYYELHHPSLPTPLRERGKEKAEARAKAIADAFTIDEGDEGTMQQGTIGDVTDLRENADKDYEPESETQARIRALEEENEKLRAQVRTVNQTSGDVPAPRERLAAVPQRFDKVLDKDAKKALEKATGVELVRIILEESADIPPTGLYLGHNGRGYMIRPGEPVDVPAFLLGVLDNAVMSAPVVDTNSQKVLGYRDRLRYPYRRV